jgi:hypothetical protein
MITFAYCSVCQLFYVLCVQIVQKIDGYLLMEGPYSTGKRSVPIFQSLEQLFPTEDAQISAVPGQLLLR